LARQKMKSNSIAQAVAEVSKVIGQWMASRDRRRMKAAIDAGEQYIFVDAKEGEHENITDEKQEKLKKRFRKKLFKYN